MRTRIISAFPGTGKSCFHKKHPDTTLDSDSSLFHWIENEDGTRKKNPDFPNNYIEHIKNGIGKYEFIFVSTHKIVRDALLDNCLFFYLLYPSVEYKDLYLQRYKERGSPESFISSVESNWEEWLWQFTRCSVGCKNIEMSFSVLELELKYLIASEQGDVTVETNETQS